SPASARSAATPTTPRIRSSTPSSTASWTSTSSGATRNWRRSAPSRGSSSFSSPGPPSCSGTWTPTSRPSPRSSRTTRPPTRSPTDNRSPIPFIPAMAPQPTDQPGADTARLYDWGLANVFADLADPDKATNDAWSVVVLPTPRDFLRWLVHTYGQDAVNSF